MGVDSKRAPPIPAPTETESILASELTTDVSKATDEKSSVSLPEDGTPVTIKTRGHQASRSQTSLLIEYFEGGNTGAAGSTSDRKPSVRVRLTPSKKSKGERVQITEEKSTRKASLSRRAPVTPSKSNREALEGEDTRSMESYASATEESNVSRNPVEIEIDRSGRKRRPASPLIPAADSKATYQPGNMSEISAIPTDSFLDGSGPTRTPEGKRSKSPSRAGELLAAGATGAVVGAAIDKMRSNKSRGSGYERVAVKKSAEKVRDKSSSKHKTKGEKDGVHSPRRRSSRGHQESVLSGESVLSSNLSPSHRSLDTHSVRSNVSKSSINNPKLLETVEDAIRRLILPELSALKREQSKRESGGRRGSLTSTGTSVSREEVSTERRKPADKRSESARETAKRRDREGRHDYTDSSPRSVDRESYDSSVRDVDTNTPRRSSDRLKAAIGGAAVGAALTGAALHEKSPDDKRQRRRRRSEHRSRSEGSDRFAEEFDEDYAPPVPPMPLMGSELASDLTRMSIQSADTDRPHSATEESIPVQEVTRGVASATPTPTRTPLSLQKGLGTQHANISHGDLKALPIKRRTGEFVEEQETDDFVQKSAPPPHQAYDEEEYDEDADLTPEPPQGYEHGYYNTQDVPAPLNYVPYQPHQRGLSPIYSVSGYTEGGSEIQQQRDSRATHTTSSQSSPEKSPYHEGAMHSPGSAPSNMRSREFDAQSAESRSLRSSGVDRRNTTYTDDSELDRVMSGQAVRGVGANPNFVHVPHGVESAVASLVDGSMLDQSVLTTGSAYDYGNRGSTLSYDDRSKSNGTGNASPNKHSVHGQHEFEVDRESTPVSRQNRSREFAEEYDVDEYGQKYPRTRYRQSPTESEAAITAGAVGAAAAALKAAQSKKQPTVEDIAEEEFIPAGVGRNKSFKERTQEGREPANTPTHSFDRLEYSDHPKMVVSGIPDANDPIPEIGYVDDDELTNPSVVQEPLGGIEHGNRDHWPAKATPGQPAITAYEEDDHHESGGSRHGLGIATTAAAAAAATAAAMAATHSQRPSQELDDEWHRTSQDQKRDTLVTNPFEDASPIVNPDLNGNLLSARGLGNNAFTPGYHTGSPGLQQTIDEGYISHGPVRSPEVQNKGKGVDFLDTTMGGMDDPFYVPKGHSKHLSGLSHGMESPIYDGATGAGIESIESRDIHALMQYLTVRDARRFAFDEELLTTVCHMAAEMRNNFDNMKKIMVETEDVIISEVQENTEKSLHKAINGPRPMPGSAPRSVKGGSQAGTDDLPAKRRNFLRRALLGLSTKGTNDLSRIEDMLMQLLSEVGDLKAQQGGTVGATNSGQGPSYENIQAEGQYEQDHGYEPEGHAGTSTASHASQSGHLSIPQSRRKFSDHRISTVPEANEDDDYDRVDEVGQYGNPDLLTPGHLDQRGSSVPLATPPEAAAPIKSSRSNENTPKTDKAKKHKSSGSSSWLPKISHWSGTTASSVGKALRNSGTSRKSRQEDDGYLQHPPSRSGSDIAAYDGGPRTDPYGDDKLHSGFSHDELPQTSEAVDLDPPRAFMTPEDPKYKAHRNSLNLQHPQPRAGQTERFKAALESQAQEYDSPMSPRSADWAGSATSLNRFPNQNTNRYSDSSAMAGGQDGEYWAPSPAGHNSGPPRPPKEPLENPIAARTPPRSNRFSKLLKGSPLPHQSIESGYVTGTGTHASYNGSPKLENRNLSGVMGGPTRRPSGPRAMTPKSAEEDEAREDRRRKRSMLNPLTFRMCNVNHR
jgi:hypothetical protein